VLPPSDRAPIIGYLINKFRGDVRLFDGGLTAITAHTGWRSFGVVPFLPAAAHLPAEDSMIIEGGTAAGNRPIRIAVAMVSRIANFDDADPLRLEPDVDLIMVPPGRPLPGDADLVILPGTKATRADMDFFRAQGWDIDLAAHVRRGGRVLGLCGGYQMLGRTIIDPEGAEGEAGATPGLGLLQVDTVLTGEKSVRPVTGRHLGSGEAVAGYEIHVGRTSGADCGRPVLSLDDGTPDGASSGDGRIAGTYVHGLFTNDGFRHAFLAGLRPRRASGLAYEAAVEAALDSIADALEACLDIDGLLAASRPVGLD
jgi:adenosylcobyric acid synthase